ncbi:MAG TPA: hypothetical protein VGG85_05100 [Terracidiphilus sp.]|jgi:predicted aldo/keto reductase-like oxidoreductase
MKPFGGHGEPVQKGVFSAEELLKYAMSLPVITPTEALSYAMSVPGISTTISGMDSMGVFDQNLQILHGFQHLGEKQMTRYANTGAGSTMAAMNCSRARLNMAGILVGSNTTFQLRKNCLPDESSRM